MSAGSSKGPRPAQPGLQEERYSLRAMLEEVALESHAGAIGAEKLHRNDVRKIFRAKPKKRRATQG